MKARIVVSAVCVFDNTGRLLTVRKRGTSMFMHPGGKPEAGETVGQTAARELAEEVGIVVDPRELQLMGVWIADAANEAATDIEAAVFLAPGTWEGPSVRRNCGDPVAGPGWRTARGPRPAADGPYPSGTGRQARRRLDRRLDVLPRQVGDTGIDLTQ
jgi:8-oxo-dGTP pyrophosphatase MutT (NUDIX family)